MLRPVGAVGVFAHTQEETMRQAVFVLALVAIAIFVRPAPADEREGHHLQLVEATIP